MSHKSYTDICRETPRVRDVIKQSQTATTYPPTRFLPPVKFGWTLRRHMIRLAVKMYSENTTAEY